VNILGTMFDWPQGIVVGNLIASAITTSLGLWWHRWQMSKHEDRYRIVIKELREEIRRSVD
jgi:hypothetical protein